MTITVDDVAEWAGITLSATDEAHLAACIAGLYDAAGDLYTFPSAPDSDQIDRIGTAFKLAALRLWRRRQTPEGVAEFGDYGPIRILRFDPDVDALLGRWRQTGLA